MLTIISHMQFEYEIPIEEYVAAQTLQYKKSMGRKRLRQGVFWGLVSIGFIVNWLTNPGAGWPPFLLAVIGVMWIYSSFSMLFPRPFFRLEYKKSGALGKRYSATLDSDALTVRGEICTWFVRWSGVTISGEDKSVFMFYGANTVFIFGKQFLTSEQQREMRSYLALATGDQTEQIPS